MSLPHRHDPLSNELVDALDEEDLARSFEAVQKRRVARRATRRSFAIASAAAAIALTSGLALSARFGAEPPAGPLRTADQRPIEVVPDGRAQRLSDGSFVTTARNADLRVLENTANRVEWRLSRGRVRFDVRPHGPRRWTIASGGVSVEVVGTSFVVDRHDESVRVDVMRGVVIVRHPTLPDGVRRLERGESTEVRVESQRPVIAPSPPVDAPAQMGARMEVPAPATPTPSAPASLILMRNADDARRGGRQEEAIAALSALVSQHPESNEAPLAAFTLARLQEDRGRSREAARAYRQAIALGLGGPLVEEAYDHWNEAAVNAGDLESAREALRRYEARRPEGRYLGAMRARTGVE